MENSEKLIGLIGLGAIGAPLADLLYQRYNKNFILLSSRDFLHTLTDNELVINKRVFSPLIVTDKKQLAKDIDVLFVCVKNYHIESIP